MAEDYIRQRDIREVMTAFHVLAPVLRDGPAWPNFVAQVNGELTRLRARQRVGPRSASIEEG